MDATTILELVLIAFGGGAAWGTLRSRLKTLDEDLRELKTNDLHAIQETLDELPCRETGECPRPV